MTYKVKRVELHNDGTVTEGKRVQIITWPVNLDIGGLYFLRPGKLYRIISKEVSK